MIPVTDCIFCKIARKEIDSNIVYEDDDMIVFKDAQPQAPIHLLAITKEHISSLNEVDESNKDLVSNIIAKIPVLAKEMGFEEDGYRLVNNIGQDGGQSVKHIHFHVLAGRSLQWPPG